MRCSFLILLLLLFLPVGCGGGATKAPAGKTPGDQATIEAEIQKSIGNTKNPTSSGGDSSN